VSTARPQQKPASGRIKATWETVGLSPASSVCATAFRLRVSIVVRTRLLTAVNVLLIPFRHGCNHSVVATKKLSVRAAARPSWAALTRPCSTTAARRWSARTRRAGTRTTSFYNICTDPQYGFHEFHATTLDNPLLPKHAGNESVEAWLARRARFHESLRRDNDPLVYAQEYLAEFVDWAGVAFFSREKLLVDNQPLPLPARSDAVFAVIDTASKTGTDNDATAVTFFAVERIGGTPLLVLDWDIVQIEGALLETWLPQVFVQLEELARLCGARRGSIGAFIEDQNSGTILLQQALRRQMRVHAIDSKLTAMGKDERAISVSGYVHRESVKYTGRAFEKTVIYKRHSRNHLLDQVESFRIGDRDSDREDDLLDTFCYGIALALGNSEGF
jgi:hypothetical protein